MQITSKLQALQELTALFMTKLEDVEVNFVPINTGDTIFQISGHVKTSPAIQEAETCLKQILSGKKS